MQKVIIIILISLLTNSLCSQQLNIEYGKVISSFDYKNSDGERLANLQGSTNNHIGIGLKLPVRRNSKLYYFSGVNYNKYGAKASDNVLGNYYDWYVNYVGVNLSMGYDLFNTNFKRKHQSVNTVQGMSCFIQIGVSSEFLVHGTQTINNEVYNLRGVEQFEKPFIYAKGCAGVKYQTSKTISIYLQYEGGRSFSIFKSSSNDNEKLNIISHTISLGLSVGFQPPKWCYSYN